MKTFEFVFTGDVVHIFFKSIRNMYYVVCIIHFAPDHFLNFLTYSQKIIFRKKIFSINAMSRLSVIDNVKNRAQTGKFSKLRKFSRRFEISTLKIGHILVFSSNGTFLIFSPNLPKKGKFYLNLKKSLFTNSKSAALK